MMLNVTKELEGSESDSTLGKSSPISGSATNVGVNVLAVVSVIFLLRYAMDLFVPIVLAVLFSYALDPLVCATTSLRIPRPAAAALVLLVLIGMLAFGSYSLRNEALTALDALPQAVGKMTLALSASGTGE
ncbi:MAG: hypothetical protein ABI995_15785, partial [Acidobacteriota bacterium]